MLRCIAQVSDSLGLRLGLRICISVKSTADFGANGLEITLPEQCSLPYLRLSYLILPCFDGAHFLKESFVECDLRVFYLLQEFSNICKIKNRIINPIYHYPAMTTNIFGHSYFIYTPHQFKPFQMDYSEANTKRIISPVHMEVCISKIRHFKSPKE